MKKLVAALFAALLIVPAAADAKGSGGAAAAARMFMRPAVKAPVTKRVTRVAPTVKRSTPEKATAPARQDEKDEGGFLSDVLSSAVGTVGGMAIYDALTDDDEKAPEKAQ